MRSRVTTDTAPVGPVREIVHGQRPAEVVYLTLGVTEPLGGRVSVGTQRSSSALTAGPQGTYRSRSWSRPPGSWFTVWASVSFWPHASAARKPTNSALEM